MEVKEYHIFKNAIYVVEDLQVDNIKIEKEIKNSKNIFFKKMENGIAGSFSNDIIDLSDCPELSLCVDSINNIVNEINELWQAKINLKLDNFWANINKKHEFNMPHSHPRCVFSACYYVRHNSIDNGDIIFQRTDDMEKYFYPDGLSEFTKIEHVIRPASGMLIVFPSYMTHYVTPNSSEDERISIAFNFS